MRKRKYYLPVIPGPALWYYLVILAAAFILAQGFKSAVTNMAFILLLFLPVGSAVHLLAVGVGIRAEITVPETVIRKGDAATVDLTVYNRSPFPVSYAETDVVCVDKKGEIHASGCYQVPPLPYEKLGFRDTAALFFIGEYTVEADFITVCDLFKLFRARIPCKCKQRITVLPKRNAPYKNGAVMGGASAAAPGEQGLAAGEELADIRAYRPGDSLKRIHWKLSSKSEETVVKDSVSEEAVSMCILCDMSTPFGDGLAKCRREYDRIADLVCSDTVIEGAVSAALAAVNEGGTAEVMWTENGRRESMRVNSAEGADELALKLISCRDSAGYKGLSMIGPHPCREGVPLVIFTSGADGSALKYAEQTAVPGGTDLVVCAESGLFEDPEKRAAEQETIALRLAAGGIRTHFAADTIPSYTDKN